MTIALLACAAERQESRDWRNTADCVGRKCAVQGTVVLQEVDDGVTRLYFDRERRDVSVLLVSSLFVSWPEYAGQTIVATGKARRFKRQIEIVVSRPRDIEVVDGVAPVATVEPTPLASPHATGEQATPRPAETPTPHGDDVEQMRRQIEQLEQRVRELEGAK